MKAAERGAVKAMTLLHYTTVKNVRLNLSQTPLGRLLFATISFVELEASDKCTYPIHVELSPSEVIGN